MMSGPVAYEIARFDVSTEEETLTERIWLEANNEVIWRYASGEGGTRCEAADVAGAIRSDPALSEIRADQVTRITAGPEALATLPFLLRTPGNADDYAEDKWSPAMWDEHIEVFGGPARNAYRVLYVNDKRWGAFTTSEGVYLLPEGGKDVRAEYFPGMSLWAKLDFSEEGGFSGGDSSVLGSPTPGTVAWAQMYDEDAQADITLKLRADDAETLVDWLLRGPFTEKNFWDDDHTGEKLITQLFADIAVGASDGARVTGEYLAAGKTVAGDAIGLWDTSFWTLSIYLDSESIRSALNRLGKVPHVAAIITAARNPDSAEAAAHRAAIKELGLA